LIEEFVLKTGRLHLLFNTISRACEMSSFYYSVIIDFSILSELVRFLKSHFSENRREEIW